MVNLHEIDVVTSMATHVEALRKKLDTLTTLRMTAMMNCESCGRGHNPVVALFLLRL